MSANIIGEFGHNSSTAFCCCLNFRPHRDYSNSQLKIQKQNLRTCPKCGSSNVVRTAKYFKKEE